MGIGSEMTPFALMCVSHYAEALTKYGKELKNMHIYPSLDGKMRAVVASYFNKVLEEHDEITSEVYFRTIIDCFAYGIATMWMRNYKFETECEEFERKMLKDDAVTCAEPIFTISICTVVQFEQYVNAITDEFERIMEPYWKNKDSDGKAIEAMMAAIIIGCSMVEKSSGSATVDEMIRVGLLPRR